MKTNNTEQQANLEPLLVATEKVKLYKQYTIDMSEKQQKFEEESQRHFANTIKKHQEQTEQILKNKDTIVELMVQDKNKSMDELNSLRARLYRAKAEGVSRFWNNIRNLNVNMFTIRFQYKCESNVIFK